MMSYNKKNIFGYTLPRYKFLSSLIFIIKKKHLLDVSTSNFKLCYLLTLKTRLFKRNFIKQLFRIIINLVSYKYKAKFRLRRHTCNIIKCLGINNK